MAGSCTGECCAAFHVTASLDELRRGRRENGAVIVPGGVKDLDGLADTAKVAAMLIPLGPDEVAERLGEDEPRSNDDGQWFTCRHWDEETRLCTIYPDRPQMCRDYGTEKVACTHGCGGGCGAA